MSPPASSIIICPVLVISICLSSLSIIVVIVSVEEVKCCLVSNFLGSDAKKSYSWVVSSDDHLSVAACEEYSGIRKYWSCYWCCSVLMPWVERSWQHLVTTPDPAPLLRLVRLVTTDARAGAGVCSGLSTESMVRQDSDNILILSITSVIRVSQSY